LVDVNDYELFKYPDYTLPLSVKMAEVARDHGLDVLHVHYAVPHATAAILARSMLPENWQPRVVTTLHGTDTTLFASDAAYGPAIRHALMRSDAITTVSGFLKDETQRLLKIDRQIDVIHNFFSPRQPSRSREQVRSELGVADDQALLIHCSNIRPLKRIDLILQAIANLPKRDSFKLLILAGGSFAPYRSLVDQLGIEDRIIVREMVSDIEEYFQAADLNLIASKTESFCLSILEAMCFGCPSVATRVGGIPEVIQDGINGLLVEYEDNAAMVRAVEQLITNPGRRDALGEAACARARSHFSANVIVSQYEAVYRRVCNQPRQIA
jgi:N-acetyl-alpha-D-glucosaminyl L-malate synthase BshA